MSYIDVVFDGPPGHESGRFVEVENSEGASISIGEWVQRPDGFWALRITRDALNGTPQPLIDWKASYEEALRQRDALTADAERYRFLRNHTWVEAYWIDGAGGVDTKARVTGCVDHLDQAVDMERIKERPDAAKATMCPPHRYNAFGWCDDCSHVRVPEPVGSPENGTQQP